MRNLTGLAQLVLSLLVPFKGLVFRKRKTDAFLRNKCEHQLIDIRFCLKTEYTFFYKKLGSAPGTKSFLISRENFAIIVLKVS